MMARVVLVAPALLAAAFLLAVPAARAECRLCETPPEATPSDAPSSPVRLEVEAGIDFDRLVLLGRGDGSATLSPDGTAHVSGTDEAISGRAMVGKARVRGEPGRTVRIDLPGQIELHSANGARISLDELKTDLPPVARLDSAGTLSFRFGGRIRVSGDADGDFRGDLPITVEYF